MGMHTDDLQKQRDKMLQKMLEEADEAFTDWFLGKRKNPLPGWMNGVVDLTIEKAKDESSETGM